MKPNLQSRMFWTLAAIAGLSAFLLAMAAAPVGMFPPAFTFVCGALNLGLSAFALALRASDASKSRRSPPPAATSTAPAVTPAAVERRGGGK